MQLNPLRWFGTKSATYDLSDPLLAAIFGQGVSTLSGVNVGPETALRVPAVNAAVRVIAESVASLPVNILKGNGTAKTVAKDHPLYRLLYFEPNGWTSSYDFRLQMQVDTLLHGNAYAFVNRVGGEVREILRLIPTSVAVTVDINSGEPTYEITNQAGERRKYPYTDIIHIKALSTNGFTGIAPIQSAREAIALALALEGHAARLMGNAARPGGILKFKGQKLTKEQLERIKGQWQASHNAGSSGGTAIFDSETDFQPLAFNSVDMQFVELRRFQLDEISRAFRVPPHLLSELGRVTWANAAELGRNFIDFTLGPWLVNWTGALSRSLLTTEERIDTFIAFDTSELTAANLQDRTTAMVKAVGGPYLLANEARALENRAPIAGGETLNEPVGAAPNAANDNNAPEKQAA
ncbi:MULTISPECIES: phage portal protein [unclassified Bradyrhizobium]|uniref:phage portal protein n=1 Tax=unclassified Bradyrhizobium TaxID=2631580 RepID=UPI001BAC6448|nr:MULTISPECIES: phage portal protein [unclassified Bradyrhizobium]MBR1204485.1 phage portal protein [Bradyrhizobium sp. AUGA SZCCT0124]MBR1309629.1 phage portal protein [Bradyrhizobium sp. AUGA SZCCT0051]MBR1339770.1 phage portal protein [Bradyrhizobium sp. AUGA SZCCT0105]MBR1354377.1 phage portal protein [Bradyrhizobium sp. AUGA SZCCT0045]